MLRQFKAQVRGVNHELGQRAMHRRRGKEPHAPAQVVNPWRRHIKEKVSSNERCVYRGGTPVSSGRKHRPSPLPRIIQDAYTALGACKSVVRGHGKASPESGASCGKKFVPVLQCSQNRHGTPGSIATGSPTWHNPAPRHRSICLD
jgi:hypothetical protein